ncbi:hypothetical protein OSTOST_08502 [Ostertagia ostertagi]
MVTSRAYRIHHPRGLEKKKKMQRQRSDEFSRVLDRVIIGCLDVDVEVCHRIVIDIVIAFTMEAFEEAFFKIQNEGFPGLRRRRYVSNDSQKDSLLDKAQLLLKNAGKTCIYSRLKDVQEALGKHLEEMIVLCENLPETATRDELTLLLGSEDLEECFAEGTTYCESTSRNILLMKGGSIMGRESQGILFYCVSQATDFECSSKAADKLVARCRMARAYGAHVVALIDDIRPVFLGDNLVYHAFSSSGASVEFLR